MRFERQIAAQSRTHFFPLYPNQKGIQKTQISNTMGISAVLEEFKAQEYDVRLIEFSIPLREAEYFEDRDDKSGNNDSSE